MINELVKDIYGFGGITVSRRLRQFNNLVCEKFFRLSVLCHSVLSLERFSWLRLSPSAIWKTSLQSQSTSHFNSKERGTRNPTH